ncbi:hypothetical protein Tco_1069566 [Tanacetum coccineum]|uniref:Uncharacterized protein n=1 Tax=Tanacetum coccineum TaxID=301880 RepID=A0ABQ5HJ75_9ASTR
MMHHLTSTLELQAKHLVITLEPQADTSHHLVTTFINQTLTTLQHLSMLVLASNSPTLLTLATTLHNLATTPTKLRKEKESTTAPHQNYVLGQEKEGQGRRRKGL